MFAFFVVIHLLICFALVVAVLLQSGRGGGLAGAFGGGAAQTFFGGRGAATFLSKTTAWLAVGFMVMSILLAILSSRGGTAGGGLLQERARERVQQTQLPPSSAALNPSAALDSMNLKIPGEGEGGSTGATGAAPQAGQPATGAGAPTQNAPAGQPAPGGTAPPSASQPPAPKP